MAIAAKLTGCFVSFGRGGDEARWGQARSDKPPSSVPPTLTQPGPTQLNCDPEELLKLALHFQPTSRMDIASKNDFIYWMQRAVEDQQNDCYIELYNLLLRAFVSADCDFDGQVVDLICSTSIRAHVKD